MVVICAAVEFVDSLLFIAWLSVLRANSDDFEELRKTWVVIDWIT